jgi:hypothetical protein
MIAGMIANALARRPWLYLAGGPSGSLSALAVVEIVGLLQKFRRNREEVIS